MIRQDVQRFAQECLFLEMTLDYIGLGCSGGGLILDFLLVDIVPLELKVPMFRFDLESGMEAFF